MKREPLFFPPAKPRIRRGQWFDGGITGCWLPSWICVGDGTAEQGATPRHAYERWRRGIQRRDGMGVRK